MISNIQTLRKPQTNEEGFTLLELMIVVVIIGILAAIAVPIFANQQKAAIDAKSKSHIKQLQTAIEVARVKTGKSLLEITGATCTFCGFPQGSRDPLTLPATDGGWNRYNVTLNRISEASGMDVRGLLDGYGRPIFIDENDGENGTCGQDILASYTDPYSYNGKENVVRLSYASATCFSRN